ESGSGAFTQSGGTNAVGFDLVLGDSSRASGSYTLSAGRLAVGGNENIGNYGSGAFTQSGGTNTVVGYLYLGDNAGASGTYNLSDSGSGSYLSVGGPEYIGNSGTGVFTQGGGTNTVTNDLYLAYNTGASGTYNLSSTGYLSVGGSEIIGNSGTGVFTQSGGTNAVTSSLYLGNNAGASGTYNLSGGSLSVGAFEYIGNSGTGAFTQSGGTNKVDDDLYLGFNSGASGSYNLSAGLLDPDNEYVGFSGSGAFTQSGGTNTTGFLYLGDQSGASGTYTLSGTGSLSVGSEEVVGESGSGTFTQSGGTNKTFHLILGDQTGGSGAFTLNGGSLSVVGDEFIGNAGSGVFTQSGGTNAINGNLYVGAFAGNGTYALLGGNATVGGNYTQGANGTFAPGISSPTNFAKLMVTGAASLNGTVDPVLQGGYIPAINTLFHGVITTAGGVTGAFSSVTNPINLILYWQPIYTGSTFDLLVKGNFANSAFNLTHNQANVGNMLNGVQATATGDLAYVLNVIAGLPNGSAVANAYQQISADKVASLGTMGFAGSDFFNRGLANRINNLRYGGPGASSGLSGLGGFNLSGSRFDGLMMAYNSSSLAGLITAKKEAAPETSWGVYLYPDVSLGSQKSSMNQTGFDFAMGGFTAGADYRVRDNLLVGLATGYGYTGTNLHGSGGNVQNNTWPINAYVAYLPQSFYAYGSVGYALNLFNLQRDINFGGLNLAAKSSPTGNQFNAYGETGYDLKAKSLVVTPLVSLAYSSLWVNGFTEGGAGALDLKVYSEHVDSLQTGVGAKVGTVLQRNSVKVVPQVYATYQHEFSNNSRDINASLSQGSNSFAFQTDHLGQDFALVGARVNIFPRKNFSLQIDYNAEVGRDKYTAHNVSAGVRWEF
ncbi:MAG: autotransporter domain-containing protein, partial [Desulfobaccales bacterium]